MVPLIVLPTVLALTGAEPHSDPSLLESPLKEPGNACSWLLHCCLALLDVPFFRATPCLIWPISSPLVSTAALLTF